MKSCKDSYYIVVIEDTSTKKIIGNGTLAVEFKFIHTTAKVRSISFTFLPGVSKKYPLLTGNRNEAIRYYYSPSEQLNLSNFNLDSHTLYLKIVH